VKLHPEARPRARITNRTPVHAGQSPLGRRTTTAAASRPALAAPARPPVGKPAAALVLDATHWEDPHPPACETCQSVRICTRGRVPRCRWCAADLEALTAESQRDLKASKRSR